ncbi:sterile alpha motif domain-containing protein 11-like [Brachionichthys hirsutus]|uniref:sterile alpha motif domain-containing protein 11-like n=1 Tax=Brachionichthys hirsutus TaxID=412623 RepID=UPI003604B3EB
MAADTSITMDTDSNADESRDGQDGRSPGPAYDDAAVHCVSVQAVSAPCSPAGARPGPGVGLDAVPLQKAGERPSSLPPSSPRALVHNDWAYHSAVCPAERQNPGMQKDKGAFKNKTDVSSFAAAEDGLLNGAKCEELSLKQEKMSHNLLQWTVADVAGYFSAAGFPEQAAAFRTQEIDGKSLLLMQRSDVLTGLSIRLGPALKIYERHVKVLQRTHFLESEDL